MSNRIRRINQLAGGPLTVIEVFADVWCPFTHVGLRALNEQLAARGRGDVRIWVRSWPLEWVNGKPLSASAVVRQAIELRSQVAPDLFDDFDGSHFPRSTIPVLALVAKGYKVGFRVGESLSLEVRSVLFEEGQDIGEPEILNRIGRYFDLGPPGPDDFATVVAEWKEGVDRGVRGSPHFFCGEAEIFCPSVDITEQPAAGCDDIRTNLERIASFLDLCLSAPSQSG